MKTYLMNLNSNLVYLNVNEIKDIIKDKNQRLYFINISDKIDFIESIK